MTSADWLRVAAVLGFAGVALGAFGAHGLRARLNTDSEASVVPAGSKTISTSRRIEVFETGARYQMYHALALVAVAWLASRASDHTAVNVAGWAFLLGTVLFSGSLYILGFTGIGWLGAVTPLGGVAFLVGWGALFLAAGQIEASGRSLNL